MTTITGFRDDELLKVAQAWDFAKCSIFQIFISCHICQTHFLLFHNDKKLHERIMNALKESWKKVYSAIALRKTDKEEEKCNQMPWKQYKD